MAEVAEGGEFEGTWGERVAEGVVHYTCRRRVSIAELELHMEEFRYNQIELRQGDRPPEGERGGYGGDIRTRWSFRSCCFFLAYPRTCWTIGLALCCCGMEDGRTEDIRDSTDEGLMRNIVAGGGEMVFGFSASSFGPGMQSFSCSLSFSSKKIWCTGQVGWGKKRDGWLHRRCLRTRRD